MIYREITPKIEHWIGREKALIIKGSRQVGKTTLLKHMEEKLKKSGKQTYFMSVDKEKEVGNPAILNTRNLLQFLRGRFPRMGRENRVYLFLDEFQYLPDAGLFLKAFFDESREYIQPIVSGSSSLEITKSSEFLTGRSLEFSLYPLSYREFLRYKTGTHFSDEPISRWEDIWQFYSLYHKELAAHSREYHLYGGYPEVVTTDGDEDKRALLHALVSKYTEKDIIAFFRLENVSGFHNLLKILAHQIGNMVNKSELANTTNMGINTVEKYLNILEGTYVLELVRPYFVNVRKEVSKMPKAYMNDFGFRNAVLDTFRDGGLLSGGEQENFAYNALKHEYGRENIFFYRTLSKTEIDFIVSVPNRRVPLEVKSGAAKASVALRSFRDKHENAAPYAVLANDGALAKKDSVYFIPLALLPFVDITKLS